MKLIRFGPPGKENPGILLEDGTRLDVYGFVSDDYDEHFSEMMESRGSRLGSRANPLLRPRFPLPSGLARRLLGQAKSSVSASTSVITPARVNGNSKRTGHIFQIYFRSSDQNDDVVIPKGGQKVDWEVELRLSSARRAAGYIEQGRALEICCRICSAQ
jgi:2,4-didehydro-3-deoxy-L-rhamnonate hydrolase